MINKYHFKQFETPYYSTIAFEQFLKECGCFKPKTDVLDIGAGCGANIYYMAKKYPNTNFIGMDYNKKLIAVGNEMLKMYKLTNVNLEYGDWFLLPKKLKNRFDGIFNIHTLCCFKSLTPALDALVRLHPQWLAFNSLFYQGPLDVLIHIRDHKKGAPKDNNPDADFNTFSLPMMQSYLKRRGYKNFIYQKYHIPVDLPKPKNGQRGTYTVKTSFDKRAQFSGPVYLPWYFVLASKKNGI